MIAPYFRIVVMIAALLLVQAAFAKEREASAHAFARITQFPESFDECRAKATGSYDPEKKESIQFIIAKDGSPTKLSMRDGSPDWMMELAGCALERLRFSPARRDEVPTEQTAILEIGFHAVAPRQPAEVGIESVGRLITPPKLRRSQSTDSCFPHSKAGSMSRFVVKLTVNPDGSTSDLEMPLGSESWHEETARCVLDRVTFTPGSLDGLPVKAEASLPLFVSGFGGSTQAASLRSTDEDLEAAYRACYPSDRHTMTSAFYSFDIATNGKLVNPKVAKSSGDPRLDDAGVCMLKMLEFSPMMQNGQAIRSKATWELPLRPPR